MALCLMDKPHPGPCVRQATTQQQLYGGFGNNAYKGYQYLKAFRDSNSGSVDNQSGSGDDGSGSSGVRGYLSNIRSYTTTPSSTCHSATTAARPCDTPSALCSFHNSPQPQHIAHCYHQHPQQQQQQQKEQLQFPDKPRQLCIGQEGLQQQLLLQLHQQQAALLLQQRPGELMCRPRAAQSRVAPHQDLQAHMQQMLEQLYQQQPQQQQQQLQKQWQLQQTHPQLIQQAQHVGSSLNPFNSGQAGTATQPAQQQQQYSHVHLPHQSQPQIHPLPASWLHTQEVQRLLQQQPLLPPPPQQQQQQLSLCWLLVEPHLPSQPQLQQQQQTQQLHQQQVQQPHVLQKPAIHPLFPNTPTCDGARSLQLPSFNLKRLREPQSPEQVDGFGDSSRRCRPFSFRPTGHGVPDTSLADVSAVSVAQAHPAYLLTVQSETMQPEFGTKAANGATDATTFPVRAVQPSSLCPVDTLPNAAFAAPTIPPSSRHKLPLLSSPTDPVEVLTEGFILHAARALRVNPDTSATLALHIWRRISGMVRLLLSIRRPTVHLTFAAGSGVGTAAVTAYSDPRVVTATTHRIYAAACLWLGSKLEGQRLEVPGAALIAALAQTAPGVISAVEIRVLEWVDWRPCLGYVP